MRSRVGPRGFSRKPCLLARSRGGLRLYHWAAEHPDAVGGIAGIYPVCNLRSWPGLSKASGAYGLTAEQLGEQLARHNPIDRLAPLAKAGVPIFHIHGDADKTVPLDAHSATVASRYRELGGSMRLRIPPGQGHNGWDGWDGFFQCQELVEIVSPETGAAGQTETITVRHTAPIGWEGVVRMMARVPGLAARAPGGGIHRVACRGRGGTSG